MDKNLKLIVGLVVIVVVIVAGYFIWQDGFTGQALKARYKGTTFHSVSELPSEYQEAYYNATPEQQAEADALLAKGVTLGDLDPSLGGPTTSWWWSGGGGGKPKPKPDPRTECRNSCSSTWYACLLADGTCKCYAYAGECEEIHGGTSLGHGTKKTEN